MALRGLLCLVAAVAIAGADARAVPAASPGAPDIAALAALQPDDTEVRVMSVPYYATPGDGGGGIFVWQKASTAAPDRCLVFGAPGGGPGRWVRQLQGVPFSVDMCGTGTSDDSVAFRAAFSVCAGQGVHLSLSARHYYLRATLNPPPHCAWDGMGSMGYGSGTLPTVLDFSRAGPAVTEAVNVTGPGGAGDYKPALPFGHFAIMGHGSSLKRGLYVSRLLGLQIHDVSVTYIPGGGPCFHIGQVQQSAFDFLYAYGCGSPTSGEIVFDGETESTTTTAGNIFAESDAGNRALCGVMIDHNLDFALLSGDAEWSGTPLCINRRGGAVLGVTVSNFDMEGPSNGASHCVMIGPDAGGGVVGTNIAFSNFICQAVRTPITSAFLIRNTRNFRATNGYTQFPVNGGTIFAFEGANEGAVIDGNTGPPGQTSHLVRVAGALVPGANADTPWYMAAMPAPVAKLHVCNTSYLGVRRIVIDATRTPAVGIGSVVAGGGPNTVAVGCDGTSWRIGG